MPKSLVLGGNGFLGSHLTDMLSDLGHQVTVFDRFSSGRPNFSSRDTEVIAGDFGDHVAVADAVSGQDYVFHFLASSSPFSSVHEGASPMIEGLKDHQALINACIRNAVSHLYYASSGGSIYGDQGLEMYAESDKCEPVSPYAIEKVTVEHLLRYARVSDGLRSTSFRIANPYGPRQKMKLGQGLVPTAFQAAQNREQITQLGTGDMIRDFIYIDDLMEMIRQLVTFPHLDVPVVNLGSGQATSVAEVLDAVEEEVGPLNRKVVEPPPGLVHRVVLDMTLFRSISGVRDVTARPILEGIRDTLAASQGECMY